MDIPKQNHLLQFEASSSFFRDKTRQTYRKVQGVGLLNIQNVIFLHHRSDFAVKGGDMTVNSEVERVIKEFHGAKKPIGLCCIAPVLAARVLGSSGVTLTLGKSGECALCWEAFTMCEIFSVH